MDFCKYIEQPSSPVIRHVTEGGVLSETLHRVHIIPSLPLPLISLFDFVVVDAIVVFVVHCCHSLSGWLLLLFFLSFFSSSYHLHTF